MTRNRASAKSAGRSCAHCEQPMPSHKRDLAQYCSDQCQRRARYRREGRTPIPSPEVRFWSRVDKTASLGCWVWTAGKLASGYGSIRFNNSAQVAHRVAWEWLRGPIPDGLELDHLCRNRACVNPDHLQPVTHVVNGSRGVSPHAINARKTQCVNGHEFTPENTYRTPSQPQYRCCRTCRDAKNQSRYSPNTGECQHCGGSLLGKIASAVFCSRKCAQRFRRQVAA